MNEWMKDAETNILYLLVILIFWMITGKDNIILIMGCVIGFVCSPFLWFHRKTLSNITILMLYIIIFFCYRRITSFLFFEN